MTYCTTGPHAGDASSAARSAHRDVARRSPYRRRDAGFRDSTRIGAGSDASVEEVWQGRYGRGACPGRGVTATAAVRSPGCGAPPPAGGRDRCGVPGAGERRRRGCMLPSAAPLRASWGRASARTGPSAGTLSAPPWPPRFSRPSPSPSRSASPNMNTNPG
jgi:hypothetical protein